MATSAEAEHETDRAPATEQSSTEELCREAAQKLMQECHATTTSSKQRSAHCPHELTAPQCGEGAPGESDEVESTTLSGQGDPALTKDAPGSDAPPPSYNEVTSCNESVQIPIERGDGTTSYHVPPPPPPSPGDALCKAPKHTPRHVAVGENQPYPVAVAPMFPPALGLVYPYGTPNPMVVGGHSAYSVVAAPSPLICMQAAPPMVPASQVPGPTTAAPSTVVNQNSANATNQNVNNVNVVVENNIGLGDQYPSYICFSLTLCFICCLFDPTALVCVIPALICSCVACCAGRYELSRQTGKCALVCNIIALVYGITAFFLLIVPVIVIPVLLVAYSYA